MCLVSYIEVLVDLSVSLLKQFTWTCFHWFWLTHVFEDVSNLKGRSDIILSVICRTVLSCINLFISWWLLPVLISYNIDFLLLPLGLFPSDLPCFTSSSSPSPVNTSSCLSVYSLPSSRSPQVVMAGRPPPCPVCCHLHTLLSVRSSLPHIMSSLHPFILFLEFYDSWLTPHFSTSYLIILPLFIHSVCPYQCGAVNQN